MVSALMVGFMLGLSAGFAPLLAEGVFEEQPEDPLLPSLAKPLTGAKTMAEPETFRAEGQFAEALSASCAKPKLGRRFGEWVLVANICQGKEAILHFCHPEHGLGIVQLSPHRPHGNRFYTVRGYDAFFFNTGEKRKNEALAALMEVLRPHLATGPLGVEACKSPEDEVQTRGLSRPEADYENRSFDLLATIQALPRLVYGFPLCVIGGFILVRRLWRRIAD